MAGPESEHARSESGAAGSVPHPLEYLSLRDLPSGHYSLRVVNAATGSADTAYGLAWFLDLAPAAPPEIVPQWSADAQSLTLTFSRLGTGLTYSLQQSGDLLSWSHRQSITAASTSVAVALVDPNPRVFYRLVWSP